MLTEKSLRSFGSVINFGNFIGITPFVFDTSTQRISVNRKKKLRKLIFFLQCFSQFAYTAFLVTKLTSRNSTGYQIDYGSFLWLVFFNIGLLWSSSSIVCVWLRRYDIVNFINSTVRHLKTIHSGNEM
jgi:hypothetical protein